MAQISREQLEALEAAVSSHDFLSRVAGAIEQLHRVVFHDHPQINWSLVRRSADQILIAEIVNRHRGSIDGVYFALRELENRGTTWDAAIRELAGGMHSYYTTPLGVVMRQDLFGDQVVFISPDAYEWTRQADRKAPKGATEQS